MVQNNNINLKTDLFSQNSKAMDLKSVENKHNKSNFKEVFNKEVKKDSSISKETKTFEDKEEISLEEDKKEIKDATLTLLAEILNLLNQSRENLDYEESLKLDGNIEKIETFIIDLESMNLDDMNLEELNQNFEVIKKTSETLFEDIKTLDVYEKDDNDKLVNLELGKNPEENSIELEKKSVSKLESEEKFIANENIIQEQIEEIDVATKKAVDPKNMKINKQDNKDEDIQINVVANDNVDEILPNIQKKDEEIDININQMDSKLETFIDKMNINKNEDTTFSSVEEIEQSVIKQVASKIEFNLNEGKNQAIIQLKPEMLGKVKMELEVEKNTIVAKILVDNHKTKEIFENNMSSLLEKLEENGMKIKTVEVFVGNNSDFNQNEGQRKFDFQNGQNKKFKSRKNKLEISKNYETGTIDDESMKKEIDLSKGMNLLA